MIPVCLYLFYQLVGQQFVSFSLFADLVDDLTYNRYAVDSYVADLRSVTSTTTNKHDFDTQLPFFIYQKAVVLSSGVVPTPSVRLASTRRQPVLPLVSRSVRPARPGYSNRCRQVAPPRLTRARVRVPPRAQHLHQTLRSLRLPVSF